MNSSLEARRREALLFLLTAIILALLVSLLSNILYEYYIIVNKKLFIIVTAIALLLTLGFAYFVIIGTRSEVTSSLMAPLCFNRKLKKFMDIEACVPSVHARVHFDRLPPGYKRDLAREAANFFPSRDLYNFINDVVQTIFLDLVFGGSSSGIRQPTDEALYFESFPETLKRNDVIRREVEFYSGKYSLLIPSWAKLTTFGEFERNIRIKSKYGELQITWDIGRNSNAFYSASYLTAIGIDPDNDAHEYTLNAVLTYNVKHNYIHTKMLREYLAWVQKVQRNFTELDWSITREQLPLVIMQLFINEIRSENRTAKVNKR